MVIIKNLRKTCKFQILFVFLLLISLYRYQVISNKIEKSPKTEYANLKIGMNLQNERLSWCFCVLGCMNDDCLRKFGFGE